MFVKGYPQIKNDPFAHLGNQPPGDDLEQAADDWQHEQPQRRPEQGIDIPGWDGIVHQMPQDQGGEEAHPGVDQDG